MQLLAEIMAKTMKIDEDVMGVLKRSEINENSLTLPNVTLERKLYEKVNKIIVAAGGKWSKSHKAHIFDSDPRAALGMALETGEVENRQQTFQEFFTPAWLAVRMCDGVEDCHRVLEPSAGIGRIATVAEIRGARVVCCEIQAKNVEVLRANERLIVWQGDFLKFPADMLRPFNFVLMNPPFSDGQCQAHVRHAFDFLASGGKLISVMPSGLGRRETKASREFMDWLGEQDHEIEELEDDTFKESGTRVSTELLTIYSR